MADGDGSGAFAPGRDCMSRGSSFQAIGGKGTELQKQQQEQREVGSEGRVKAQLLKCVIINEQKDPQCCNETPLKSFVFISDDKGKSLGLN